jgi:N-methylhydantoinase B
MQPQEGSNAAAQFATRVDPITGAVIQGALENIAIEMGHKLMRMSYSSIIRESEDFGAALTDADGNQLCECKMSTPLQSGPIPGYIRGIKKRFAARGDAFRPGDVIMHNDPYGGASHGPDVAFCVPVFDGETLLGFSVTTAHHLDIGAHTPGSCGIVDAVDAYAEGLQFKAIKVVDQGRRNDMVWHMVRDNIRIADLVVGDMEAQIAAAQIGARRYLELVRHYGPETVAGASADLMDYSERLMRAAIREIPDGVYSATTFIDGFLDDADPSRRDLKIVVTITIKDDEMLVDLAGTAPQVPDRPINMPFEGTVDCAVWLTLRSILLDSVVYGPIPQNSGLTRPIKIVAPKGCLANPIFPAPVIARFGPGNAVADTVMKALAPAVPGQVSAGIGNLTVIAFSGMLNEQQWVHMEILEGSYGGRSGLDGMDTVDTLYANTRNNPIEDIESHLPLRVQRYELREDRAAPGEWRGGVGSVREFLYLTEGGFSVEGEGHKFRPWGFDGGADGLPSALVQVASTGDSIELPSKVPYHKAKAGDRLISYGPSGGGYGDPLLRAPEAVLENALDGIVSAAQAREQYGVAIAAGSVDPAATEALRAELRRVRAGHAVGAGVHGG